MSKCDSYRMSFGPEVEALSSALFGLGLTQLRTRQRGAAKPDAVPH
jgi:hypothetical protein